jgi:uncharacterized protein YigE (DUF2233 family)
MILQNPFILPALLAMAFASALFSDGASNNPACTRKSFEGQMFSVCPYDPSLHAISLHLKNKKGGMLRSLTALRADIGSDGPPVRFAMNAGMYDIISRPIGLYVENGKRLHPVNTREAKGNFYLKPNGVFWVDRDGRGHVTTTDRYLTQSPNPLWATQSGPMLVIDGALHPRFEANGTSLKNRNGVGVDDAGVSHFVISDAPVSFGTFARFFRDKLRCKNALFLDGSVSSLWEPGAHRMDSHYFLGPIILVRDQTTR